MRFPVVLALVLLAGCTHDAWDGRVYRTGTMAFRTGAVDAQWERVSVEGALLTFRDRGSGGTVSVYGRCGVDGDDVPLQALTQHLLIGFTERDLVEQTTVPMSHREALHTVARGKLDGVPVMLGIYVLKKDGCVYDLVYAAAPERFASGNERFDAFAIAFDTQ